MASAPPKKKSRGELANTPGNRDEILALIEKKLGPVGKGHHESHRAANIKKWLASKGKKKS